MATGYGVPRKITDDEQAWLEQARAEPPEDKTRCCARCRRGPIPGQFPCAYADHRWKGCPNRECDHHRR